MKAQNLIFLSFLSTLCVNIAFAQVTMYYNTESDVVEYKVNGAYIAPNLIKLNYYESPTTKHTYNKSTESFQLKSDPKDPTERWHILREKFLATSSIDEKNKIIKEIRSMNPQIKEQDEKSLKYLLKHRHIPDSNGDISISGIQRFKKVKVSTKEKAEESVMTQLSNFFFSDDEDEKDQQTSTIVKGSYKEKMHKITKDKIGSDLCAHPEMKKIQKNIPMRDIWEEERIKKDRKGFILDGYEFTMERVNITKDQYATRSDQFYEKEDMNFCHYNGLIKCNKLILEKDHIKCHRHQSKMYKQKVVKLSFNGTPLDGKIELPIFGADGLTDPTQNYLTGFRHISYINAKGCNLEYATNRAAEYKLTSDYFEIGPLPYVICSKVYLHKNYLECENKFRDASQYGGPNSQEIHKNSPKQSKIGYKNCNKLSQNNDSLGVNSFEQRNGKDTSNSSSSGFSISPTAVGN